MKKVAVFGKPGGGKSTFSRKLAQNVGIPFYPLDLIEYNKDGTKVDLEVFAEKHQNLLDMDKWIIDGFETIDLFFKRLDCADTFIYIHLPYKIHYWWVIKRLLKSPVSKPVGWPKGSSVWKGTVASFKTLKICPKFWNDDFLNALHEKHPDKEIIVFKSVREMKHFLKKYK